jgi:hypothetical protein
MIVVFFCIVWSNLYLKLQIIWTEKNMNFARNSIVTEISEQTPVVKIKPARMEVILTRNPLVILKFWKCEKRGTGFQFISTCLVNWWGFSISSFIEKHRNISCKTVHLKRFHLIKDKTSSSTFAICRQNIYFAFD